MSGGVLIRGVWVERRPQGPPACLHSEFTWISAAPVKSSNICCLSPGFRVWLQLLSLRLAHVFSFFYSSLNWLFDFLLFFFCFFAVWGNFPSLNFCVWQKKESQAVFGFRLNRSQWGATGAERKYCLHWEIKIILRKSFGVAACLPSVTSSLSSAKEKKMRYLAVFPVCWHFPSAQKNSWIETEWLLLLRLTNLSALLARRMCENRFAAHPSWKIGNKKKSLVDWSAQESKNDHVGMR